MTGFKFAITDFDTVGEAISVRAFPVPTGGTAIGLTDHLLSNPTALPELARGRAHTGNDAYVVDQTRVSVSDGGVYGYSLATTSATSNQNGTVLFVFDEPRPSTLTITTSAAGRGHLYGERLGPLVHRTDVRQHVWALSASCLGEQDLTASGAKNSIAPTYAASRQ